MRKLWQAIKKMLGYGVNAPAPTPTSERFVPKLTDRQERAEVRRARRGEKRLRDAANGGWWRPGRPAGYARPLWR